MKAQQRLIVTLRPDLEAERLRLPSQGQFEGDHPIEAIPLPPRPRPLEHLVRGGLLTTDTDSAKNANHHHR